MAAGQDTEYADQARLWIKEATTLETRPPTTGRLLVFRVPKASDGYAAVTGVRISDIDTNKDVLRQNFPNNAAPPVVAVLELGRTYQISSATNDLCDDLANCDCCLDCSSEAAFFTPTVKDPVGYLLLKTVPRLQQQVFLCGGCLCGQKMNLNLLVDQQRFLQALLKAERIGKRIQFMRGVVAGLRVATMAGAGTVAVLNEGAATMEATAIEMERDQLHFENTGELPQPRETTSQPPQYNIQEAFAPAIHAASMATSPIPCEQPARKTVVTTIQADGTKKTEKTVMNPDGSKTITTTIEH